MIPLFHLVSSSIRPLTDLPVVVLSRFCNYLTLGDLCQLALTCKKLNNISHEDLYREITTNRLVHETLIKRPDLARFIRSMSAYDQRKDVILFPVQFTGLRTLEILWRPYQFRIDVSLYDKLTWITGFTNITSMGFTTNDQEDLSILRQLYRLTALESLLWTPASVRYFILCCLSMMGSLA
jgi:F-box-like